MSGIFSNDAGNKEPLGSPFSSTAERLASEAKIASHRPLNDEEFKSFSSSDYAKGADLNALQRGTSVDSYDKLVAWRDNNQKVATKYAEYLKQSKDRPGRQATVLSQDNASTVLGGM